MLPKGHVINFNACYTARTMRCTFLVHLTVFDFLALQLSFDEGKLMKLLVMLFFSIALFFYFIS